MVENTKMISFRDISNGIGHLTPIESEIDIPFAVKRIYYITQVPKNVTRGFHSHRNLEQVLVCLNGEVKIRVKTPDDEDVITLRNDSVGLYIGNMVWREMFDFSDQAVLLVLASAHYNEADYIRDYISYEQEAQTYFEHSRLILRS